MTERPEEQAEEQQEIHHHHQIHHHVIMEGPEVGEWLGDKDELKNWNLPNPLK